MSESETFTNATPPPPRSKLRNLALGMVLGSAVAILAAIVFLKLSGGPQLPVVTFEILNAAVARWSAGGLQSYDLDIEQTGVNPSLLHVEVRNGQVTAMTMNGRPTPRHIWDDWTVPSLFAIIRRDLEVCMAASGATNLAENNSNRSAIPNSPSPLAGEGRGEGENPPPNAQRTTNAPQPDIIQPRGTFDPQLGYPTQYHRVTPTGQDAKWAIKKFKVVGTVTVP